MSGEGVIISSGDRGDESPACTTSADFVTISNSSISNDSTGVSNDTPHGAPKLSNVCVTGASVDNDGCTIVAPCSTGYQPRAEVPAIVSALRLRSWTKA
jgi:hypothetical protein